MFERRSLLLNSAIFFCYFRSDDGLREEDLRADGREDADVEVLDALGVGDEHHQQGEEGVADIERSHRADAADRTFGHQEEVRCVNRVRHCLRALGLYTGIDFVLVTNRTKNKQTNAFGRKIMITEKFVCRNCIAALLCAKVTGYGSSRVCNLAKGMAATCARSMRCLHIVFEPSIDDAVPVTDVI